MDQHSLISTNVKIIYYTHPLCPVSWTMQDDWQRFVTVFGQGINFRFCMSGLAQAAPQETEPGPDGNTKLPAAIACQAVKAASLQSQWAADLYLDALRKAAMTTDQDISQMDVLVDIGRNISRDHRKVFDLQRFGMDVNSRITRRALQEDLMKIRINKVERFPTITFTVDGKGIKLTGHNTYEQLVAAYRKLSGTTVFNGNISSIMR